MTEIKDLTIPVKLQEKFDLVVQQCSGALNTGVNSIKDSLLVMNGIRSLKMFFNMPEVKELVICAQDTKAGFMTDRSPAAIRRHNSRSNKKYDLQPYTYDQIVNALLPCVLEGYTMHGNEINIIAGTGVPVKNGKYNKIINKYTTAFQEKIGVPTTRSGEPGFIFVRCSAEWKINEEKQHIGVDESDACVFKIKYDEGKYDSIDKIIGLAQSKLYTRVLIRITGKFIPEEPEEGVILGGAHEVMPKAKPKIEKPESDEELHPAVIELKTLFENPLYAEDFNKLDMQEIEYAINNNQAKSAAKLIEEAKIGG